MPELWYMWEGEGETLTLSIAHNEGQPLAHGIVVIAN